MKESDQTGPYKPEDTEVSAEQAAADQPRSIGRYRVKKVLGKGAFGLVYLAQDDQLNRPVAIKVPHRRLVARPEDALVYLREAQCVANLDHPHIIPVFDVGSTPDFPCFIVSKYIEGRTLAKKIKEEPPSVVKAAELVALVAEALHYAHRQGLVHRDIKPGNILLDAAGKPHVADFGMALREREFGTGPNYAGTPAYMSPEQARGEGHRVDGRSDVFSLGVVFYELLTGRQPFRADSQAELMDQITSHEPRPLRQIDEDIPRELERICFKALSKRAAERYSTAKDLAEDLRQFLAEQTVDQGSSPTGKSFGSSSAVTVVLPGPPPATTRPSGTSLSAAPQSATENRFLKIIPKGLRSFDAHDADFFLELLPGPRDRDGLPDSIRFWKTRIEETEPDNTFTVGLIYGPSGCGKSSLVKAGLLPRLSSTVIPVYLEATAGETEIRLLNGLRKRCPALPTHLGLKETLAALRLGQGLAAGKTMLLVLDQFEQWLHARREEQNTELVQALRQCDGARVKCIVMVRDDFWMAATRFMRELETDLVPGQNIAAVDLFALRHARKVLTAYGHAYGALPEAGAEPGPEQKAFLEQAVAGLAQEGKIICVRLALFAEMMKGRPWTLASLREVGGTEGVGVTFLEETFSSPTASPKHRLHQQAARVVLKALLPESGANIRGHMRSTAELLAASGYADRPRDFDELLRILDSEIRLITPTDPEGKQEDKEARRQADKDNGKPRQESQPEASAVSLPPCLPVSLSRYYQLTHDYLIPSLRDWLTRKQKETRQGRAELLLADRAAIWNARPENRQLPSFPQWTALCLLTQRKSWTEAQRKMMRKATRYHALQAALLAGLLLVAVLAGLGFRRVVIEQNQANRAAGLVQQLLVADSSEVPAIIREIEKDRTWADPLLREENDKAAEDSRQKLYTSLALVPVDAGQVDYLYGRLIHAGPRDLRVIRDALLPYRHELLNRLWRVAEKPPKGQEQQRLRAAAALADYDPASGRWTAIEQEIGNDLVQVQAAYFATWLDLLRPVGGKLVNALTLIFLDAGRHETERSLATAFLIDYAGDQPELLADLLLGADELQFVALYPKVEAQQERVAGLLLAEINRPLHLDNPEQARKDLAKRQANASVALLKMDRPAQVWPLLRHSRDPRVRSYLIHRLGPLGVAAGTILQQLRKETDPSIRQALLLSLGEYGERELPSAERKPLLGKLQELYGDDDPGLRAAAEWLLRRWGQDSWLKEMDQQWAKDKERRSRRLDALRCSPATKPQWYVNGQGQTMVVLPGQAEFVMGSPTSEPERDEKELQRSIRLPRPFAIAAKPVTVEQFLRFRHDFEYSKRYAPRQDCPVNGVTWYLAAAYCNWLSKEEGLPETEWCYVPNRGQYREGMKLAADYLKRTGYRLPTEAEWEYACRSGTVTSRYYGDAEELLGKYAWYMSNSGRHGWPVGSLKPNDWGLFDMHGNIWTWCQEKAGRPVQAPPERAIEDVEDSLSVVDTEPRVLRGGSFPDAPAEIRAACRILITPGYPSNYMGVRPARTFR